MTLTLILIGAGLVLCVFLSYFFSGAEMTYSSCNRLRLEGEAEDGSKAAKIALHIVDRFNDALGAILIGNNLVNIAASSLLSVGLILLFEKDPKLDLYNAVGTVALTVIIIICGETIPKINAKRSANTLALKYARPVRFLMIVLKPLVLLVVGLVNLLTRGMKGEKTEEADEKVEELQSMIETAEDEEVIDEQESELVRNAIAFREFNASEAMTARVDVTAIDLEDDWEDILDTVRKAHFTRIPVYEDSIDHVVGILHMNRFLKELTRSEDPGQPVDLKPLLMEPCFVYKTMKLPEVLKVIQKNRQHLAIVVDEYGGTLGVVSLEDVLEKVVGEIWDETDTVEKEVVRRTEREYEIDGDMPISEFLDLVGIREEKFDFESETVGGWTIEHHGTFPKVGTTLRYDRFGVTILAMEDRRVSKVLLVLDPAEDKA